ncbi:hypothetical protein HQQ81_12060 [Microbacteriaceae bacterium VKM Ac-2854]|nr:hypothetical protein [Microbacteriaceae bacterium VKM Ac-2854]
MTDFSGATSGARPAAANDSEHTEIDRAQSPGSERETEAKQNTAPARAPETSGEAEVKQVPGTGGPDDVGDVEVPPEEVSLNGKPFPGHAGTT